MKLTYRSVSGRTCVIRELLDEEAGLNRIHTDGVNYVVNHYSAVFEVDPIQFVLVVN